VLFEVARAVDPALQIARFASPLRLPAESRIHAAELRRRVAGGKRLLVVHAQSGEGKSWPVTHLAPLLDRFLDAHPEFAACLVGTSPHADAFGPRVARCLDLPLASAFALIAAADLFFGVDSCMLHVADLCRVPGVAVFGPTSVQTWGFRFGPGVALQGDGSTAAVGVDHALLALERVLADASAAATWRAA